MATPHFFQMDRLVVDHKVTNVSRRAFLRAISAGAAVTAWQPTVETRAEPPAIDSIPIVDTHQHLWDLTRFKLPWLADAPAVLRRSYLTNDYLEATAGLNVSQCVYMEVGLLPEQQTAEADFVVEISRSPDHPTVAGVISGRCDQETFATHISRYRDNPFIKGVRHILQALPRGFCLQKQFVRSVQLLGSLNMSFDITMRPGELSDGLQLVRQCPDTRFVIDHCGTADPKAFLPGNLSPSHNPETWKRDMARLAEQDNVICKISGIVAQAPEPWRPEHLAPVVNHCLDTFGSDRVVFGGDWPVCLQGATLGQWVAALQEIVSHRPLVEQEKLCCRNAIQHYQLTG